MINTLYSSLIEEGILADVREDVSSFWVNYLMEDRGTKLTPVTVRNHGKVCIL